MDENLWLINFTYESIWVRIKIYNETNPNNGMLKKARYSHVPSPINWDGYRTSSYYYLAQVQDLYEL